MGSCVTDSVMIIPMYDTFKFSLTWRRSRGIQNIMEDLGGGSSMSYGIRPENFSIIEIA